MKGKKVVLACACGKPVDGRNNEVVAAYLRGVRDTLAEREARDRERQKVLNEAADKLFCKAEVAPGQNILCHEVNGFGGNCHCSNCEVWRVLRGEKEAVKRG